MKIEEKKLRTWGTIILSLGILFIVLFAFRVENKFDLINQVLFGATILCSLIGVVLRVVEATKIYLRALQMIKEGKHISIG
ncbi:MAG TPA: hypothetical protein PKC87_01760 [Candidatus Absconditabacterales bacterium]|nr:hypothetical protein [Candidatus Absconditabacterales bacterium]